MEVEHFDHLHYDRALEKQILDLSEIEIDERGNRKHLLLPLASIEFGVNCIVFAVIEIISNGFRNRIFPTPSHVRSTSCLDRIVTCSGRT